MRGPCPQGRADARELEGKDAHEFEGAAELEIKGAGALEPRSLNELMPFRACRRKHQWWQQINGKTIYLSLYVHVRLHLITNHLYFLGHCILIYRDLSISQFL
jgi:hypothetical protein